MNELYEKLGLFYLGQNTDNLYSSKKLELFNCKSLKLESKLEQTR